MKTLKRTFFAILALLPFVTGMAFADTEHRYSRIFIFGASFVDSGNRFAVTGESAHPPFDLISLASYSTGGHNHTNGRTWVEVLAQEMELTEWAKPAYRDPAFGNYAYSYGRAREVDFPIGKSLSTQVNDWIANGHCTGIPMDDTLFIVDSGYADLLDILAAQDEAAILEIMNGMASSIAYNIGVLNACGARNLLFAYLPPAESSPIVPVPPDPAAPSLSAIYNYLFLQPVAGYYATVMNVTVVDFFAYISGVLEVPEAFGFTNVTDACVTPGVTQKAFCKNRKEYFWWDALHPTKEVHALMGHKALEQLNAPD